MASKLLWRRSLDREQAQRLCESYGRLESSVSLLDGRHFTQVLATLLTVSSLLVMNFFMNLNVYTQNVYEPYATSHFDGHSLLATGAIVNGLVRIVGYPLLAKLADVRLLSTHQAGIALTNI